MQWCLFFLYLQWVSNYLQFCDFSLSKSYKTYLEPMLPPVDKKLEAIEGKSAASFCHQLVAWVSAGNTI